MAATTIQTKHLGQIRGRTAEGVTQFLGIKYATLEDRLADAQLVEKHDGGIVDATKDGPTAISPSFGCDIEQAAIQHKLPPKELAQSGIDCLNLNIAVPEGTTASSQLPVFFFIHGGGLQIGANSWPQLELMRFVKLSADKNLPVIAVSINYRLGVFGFLTSDELRKAGYKANNGLRDQRVALEWVRRHIADFGGDPENVTAAGESAGAASVTYHLDSQVALFKRAIAMSGSYLFSQALPYGVHEQNYQQVISALGLENASTEERIQTLLEKPAQELIAKLPPSVLAAPAVDGDLVASAATHALTADRTSGLTKRGNWCTELMIGDCQMDASILGVIMPNLKENCAEKFTTAMNKVLSSQPDVAQRILGEYGIRKGMPDDEALPAVLNYVNDICFFAPVLTFIRGWRGNSHVYYFNEGNPWEGPWKGRATHILDVAYLTQNFQEFMTPSEQLVATTLAEDFFKFCHGTSPWPAVTNGDITTNFTARVYGPSSEGHSVGQVSEPYKGESRRRSILFDCNDAVSLDELAGVFEVLKTM
ncbi:putative carboxylesterase [Aspergillus nomiae NRRL 13137]|uniref:Putative carboxylesterase n=1 Tax=Aspergillus nomiae NRRL (strain ATCC 15546 / NRRL 13137 / CBS 260.88 / M93) TaxID=1509407 RepID=A0A0L1J0N7_ASPN3|nr:putative carboxylesterase [Aspergillus nomiae NRRL 13137]KNG84948.1 putative carboxylesterase [Aspergillus nomiae NRRL 13137]